MAKKGSARKKAENKAEQSDILRYEILYRYGGLYVDVDFKCLKPHDSLLNHCDFYVGLEAKLPKNKHPAIGNAIIASVPGHPIFKECLEGISKEETLGDPDTIQWVTGPQALCRAFFNLCDKGEYRNVASAIQGSGSETGEENSSMGEGGQTTGAHHAAGTITARAPGAI